MKRCNIIIIAIILLSFVISIYYYPQMPDEVASHWNANGEVDGHMSKFWGLFLVPILALGLFLMFLVLPMIDPLKENYKKFRRYYDAFVLMIIAFFFYIYLLTVIWNLGFEFNMSLFIIPAIGILFYFIGFLVQNAKMNWFVGIRTPWTLSNEKVWDKTHKLGGTLFKIAGIVTLFSVFFGKYSIYIVLVSVIGVSIYLIAYSYFEYQKIEK